VVDRREDLASTLEHRTPGRVLAVRREPAPQEPARETPEQSRAAVRSKLPRASQLRHGRRWLALLERQQAAALEAGAAQRESGRERHGD